MKKNTKVTAVANPFAQLIAALDPAQANALMAILSNKGVTVKKVSSNPKVVAYFKAYDLAKEAYKAEKARCVKAGEAYYESARAAGIAAIEKFYA